MDLIVVIGQFRSGASALAAGLSGIGVPMGTTFAAPVPPRMRFEYEDLDLSKILLRYMPIWKPPHVDAQTRARLTRDLVGYFGDRVRVHHSHADSLGSDLPAIGVKSGLMAPALDVVVDAAKTARLNPYVVFVRRAQDEIDRSMRECLLPFVDKKGQHWIGQHWIDRQAAISTAMSDSTPDAEVWYRRGMVEVDPRTIVSQANQRRAPWEQH